MTDESSGRLSELLSAARAELEGGDLNEGDGAVSLANPDEQAESDSSPLFEHASAAREFVETNDPQTVLEAAGLDELPDGSEPASIPEALARAEEAQLRELRALIALARIGELTEDAADEETEKASAQLEETLTDLRESLETDEGGAQTESADESDAESGADAESSTLESAIHSVTGTSVEGFGEELQSLQDRLEGLRGDEQAAEDDRESEDDHESEPTDTDQADEEEEGMLGGGLDGGALDSGSLGGDGDDSPRDRSTMYSTMPSSNRADMNAVARPSTMPDRN
ncbi:hypothetical protein [Halostagnicola larsenii]|nr:hypothetical protein [Halostagnicola larsenii]